MTRATKLSSLQQLRNLGFRPRTVIDVGAQWGTHELYETFPQAHHILLEPVLEHEPHLRQVVSRLPSAEYRICAVSDKVGATQLLTSDDRMWSHMIGDSSPAPARAHSHVRTVETTSVNELVKGRGDGQPYLVKVDVDGAELAVLAGASDLLTPENIFVVETTLLGADPRFVPVNELFREKGFVLYDMVDALYRPADNALWQVDCVFIHQDNPLRLDGPYALELDRSRMPLILGPIPDAAVTIEGFHELEYIHQVPIRWTTGFSSVQVPVSVKDLEGARLEFFIHRVGPLDRPTKICVNGKPIFFDQVHVLDQSGGIRLSDLPESSGHTTITIETTAFRPHSDPRLLGICLLEACVLRM
jgi:FkbM family methyltransferase